MENFFSLFLAAREMISIMQEYGEIVCCIGSSLNVDNLEIFNQADVRYKSIFLFILINHQLTRVIGHFQFIYQIVFIRYP